SRRHSRNSIRSLNSKPQRYWANSWRPGFRSRSSLKEPYGRPLQSQQRAKYFNPPKLPPKGNITRLLNLRESLWGGSIPGGQSYAESRKVNPFRDVILDPVSVPPLLWVNLDTGRVA